MNDLIKKDNIENMVYEIRGVQVMLDSDLAKLYQVETKRINEAVKNNPSKFPERFCFVLTNEEIVCLRSKFSTLNKSGNLRGSNYKYLPRVFTEQGIYMLATILKSKVATEVSIAIMDAFVKMRHYIKKSEYLSNRVLILEDKVDDNTRRINEIFDRFNSNDIKLPQILFKGSIYDSYSILIDILNKSKEKIIIIDNYVNKELLDIIKDINKQITIVSKNINETLKNKYKSQYTNITFKYNDSFHDRFIIIDDKLLFACGSSFKDLGKKVFFISEVDNKEYLNQIIKEVNNE